jgi:hypothetical protein
VSDEQRGSLCSGAPWRASRAGAISVATSVVTMHTTSEAEASASGKVSAVQERTSPTEEAASSTSAETVASAKEPNRSAAPSA